MFATVRNRIGRHLSGAAKNLEIRLKNYPVGLPTREDFDFVQAPIPEIKDGEVLLRNVLLSMDPAMRGWITPVKSYLPPVQLGDVMRGGCVAEVVESRNPRYPAGSVVTAMSGWCEYAKSDGTGLAHVVPGVPLSTALGPVGMTGLTAYFGLLEVGQPREGDTVLVSAAAGAVGSLVGQIAKLKGCRTVGLAGSDEKCDWIRSDLGFDAAINYKTAAADAGGDAVRGLAKAIKAACPSGVDVYFDNVGGDTLDAALTQINHGARIPICGAISQYNNTEQAPGPRNYLSLLVNRARMEGFIVFDYGKQYKTALADLAGWIVAGQIKYKEHIIEGLDTAPETLLKLFDGSNDGKLIVRIAEDPAPKSKL